MSCVGICGIEAIEVDYCALYMQSVLGVPLDMSRIHPKYPHSDPSNWSGVADILLRQEPDEEEDDEDGEGDGQKDDDEDREDNGYSE